MAARLIAAGFPAADVRRSDPRRARQPGRAAARHRREAVLLLLAHLDVVEAKREDWSTDPFSLPREGRLLLRSRHQRRQGMASQSCRQPSPLQEGRLPPRSRPDPGADRRRGRRRRQRRRVAAQEPSRSDRRRPARSTKAAAACSRNGKYLVNEVQASREGVPELPLEVNNSGGHSSLPGKDNAIYHLADALVRLGEFEFPMQLNDVTRAYFERWRRSRPARPPPT